MPKRKRALHLSLDSGSYSVTGSPVESSTDQQPETEFFLADGYVHKSAKERRFLLERVFREPNCDGYTDAQLDALCRIRLKEKQAEARKVEGLQPGGPDDADDVRRRGGRKPNANARMIDMLQRNPESRYWTAREWATALGYRSTSVIKETKTWKELEKYRAMLKAQRALDRAERT